MQNRRAWLRSALAMSAGLPIGLSMSQALMAAPISRVEEFFFHPGLAPFKIRLNSNENPYGPSEKAKKAMQNIFPETNRYPFDTLAAFKSLLAEKEGVSPDHIAIGAGSGELLCLAGVAFGISGGRILSAYPTFPLLMNYADVFNASWDQVNLNDKLEIDYEAIASRIKDDTRLVFICNPNNPTGTLVAPAKVKAFCEEVSKKVPVYADEAYLEFLEPANQLSMVDLVKQGKNVIVSRTFSKIYGLAGLRIGYVIAPPDLIRKMTRYQMGIPVNQAAIAAATASLGDESFMALSRNNNSAARKHLTDYLEKKGCFYGKSLTNFVFFESKSRAENIMSGLASRGIGIRTWDYLDRQWCRVSVGTIDEMRLLTKALDDVGV